MLSTARATVLALVVLALVVYAFGWIAAIAAECGDLAGQAHLPTETPLPLAPQKHCNGPENNPVTIGSNGVLFVALGLGATGALLGFAVRVSRHRIG